MIMAGSPRNTVIVFVTTVATFILVFIVLSVVPYTTLTIVILGIIVTFVAIIVMFAKDDITRYTS
jgi:uncharacterized membrane protein